MSSYTKSQLVSELADTIGVSRRKATRVLEQLAEIAYREAASGGFTLPGICRIDVVRRKARKARNPRTGETLLIAEHDMVRVRHLKKVRDRVTPPPPGLVTVLPDFEPLAAPPEASVAPAAAPEPDFAPPAVEAPATAPAPASTPPITAPADDATEPSAERLISFRCKNPDCRQEIEAPDDMVGTSADCPACGAPIEVPYFSEPGTLHGPALPAEPEAKPLMGRTIRIELPDDDPFE